MSTDGQHTEWRRNIAENFNRLSRVHERYRRTGDDIANVNVSSRSLKSLEVKSSPTINVNMCHMHDDNGGA